MTPYFQRHDDNVRGFQAGQARWAVLSWVLVIAVMGVFGACDEDSWVYLNGQEFFEHSFETTGLLDSAIWLTPFVAPLTDVEARGDDLLAVRVLNRGGMGGIWKPVRLILSDQELTKRQIEALIELKTAQD